MVIQDSILHTNQAPFGSAVATFVVDDPTTTIIQDSQLYNNSATFNGTVYNFAGTVVIERSIIRNNTAGDSGGGIANDNNGDLTTQNNFIYANDSAASGGAAYNFSGTFRSWHNTVVSNTATTDGGAMVNAGTLIISNTIIISNSTLGATGGILNSAGSTTANYSAILGNSGNQTFGGVTVNNPIAFDGRFIDSANGDFHLPSNSNAIGAGYPSTLVSDDIDGEGRPFVSTAPPGFDVGADEVQTSGNCFARINSGAVYNDLQLAVNAASGSDVVKVAGHCTASGATLLQLSGNLTVRGGYTTTNWTTPRFGPTILDGSSSQRVVDITGGSPTLEGFAIINGSSGDGAGIRISAVASPTVQNNFIYDNAASGFGGGIVISGNGTIQFNTLQGNANDGIHIATGNPVVYNNIVVNGTSGIGINQAGGAPDIQYNDSFGNPGGNFVGFGQGNNISADPRFVDEAGNDFHLDVDSPVLGQAGTVGTPPNRDIDDDARPQGQRRDMGADEATLYPEVLLVQDESGNTDPGTFKVYTHTLTNNGTLSDTFNLTFSHSNAWAVTLSPPGPFALDTGQAVNFTVSISVPAGATPNETGVTVITATSQANGSTTATVTDTTRVNLTPGAQFRPNFNFFLDPGTNITLTHILTNTGNATDTFEITINPTLGSWGQLVITSPYTVTLPQNASVLVPVVISVPRTADFNLENGWIISATRILPGPPLTVRVTDTITATAISGDRYISVSGVDTDNNCSVSTTPCRTIRKGINNVTVGDIVYVAQGVYQESDLRIGKQIDLLGGYANDFAPANRSLNPELTVIDGSGQNNRILVVNNGVTPRLEAFSLQGGNVNGSGGGLLVDNASPLIQGLRFLTNTATQGGGLAVQSGTPDIRNNMFFDNTATANGGGLFINNSNVTVLNNTFLENTAQVRGGGIFNTASTARISNTVFATNTATIAGGGLYRNSGAVTLDFNNFYNNSAPANPDSNVSGSNTLNLVPGFNPNRLMTLLPGSPLVDAANPNTNNPVDFEGDLRPVDQGYDLGADELAGCLAKREATGEVFGSVQVAVDAAAGGERIFVSGYCRGVHPITISSMGTISQSLHLTKSVTIQGGWDSTFNNVNPNSPATLDAEGLGRTVFISSTVAPVIENMAFINGDAAGLGGFGSQDAGGGIYNYSSDAALISVIVRDAQAEVGGGVFNLSGSPVFTISSNFPNPGQIMSNTAVISGGGFYNHSGNPRLGGQEIAHNNVSNLNGGGAGFYNHSGQPVLTHNGNRIFQNSTESAFSPGGGFYNAAGAPIINSLSLYSNTATTEGGGFYNASSLPFTITNMLLYRNDAVRGGGFYNSQGSPNLWHATIHNNRAQGGDGGGIYNAAAGSLTLGNSILAENFANDGGGFFNAGGGTPSLTHNNAYMNTPNPYSGIGAGPGSLTVDPRFVNPVASDYHLFPDSLAIDAGLLLPTITADFEDTLRPSNQGHDMGAYELGGCKAQLARTGEIFGNVQPAVDAASLITDVVRVHGHCRGVHAATIGGLGTFTQTVHLTKSLTLQGGWNEDFSNRNSITIIDAISRGHVIFIGPAISPTIEYLQITGGVDGGIYNTSDMAPTLRFNEVYSNTGTTGGAIYNADGNLFLEKANYIYNNSADFGAALYVENGAPRLQNNFIYFNTTAQNGTIYIDGGTPTIWHNTLVDNTATLGSGAYRNNGSPDIRGNIFDGGAGTILDSVNGTTGGGTVSYNLLSETNPDGDGNMPGSNNTTTNPDLTIDQIGQARTYRIDIDSSAFDSGDSTLFGLLTTDFEEHLRPSHQTMDLGADEVDGCYARITNMAETGGPVFGSIQYAVDQLSTAPFIVDVAGTCYGVNDQGGQNQGVYIDQVLILRGGWAVNGISLTNRITVTTIDARNGGHGIYLTGSGNNVIIDRFQIRNGDATDGGGIYNDNTDVLLKNNVLYDNLASRGAGFYSNGGSPDVWHNTFFNNDAGSGGGQGGGIYVNLGSITIRNNIFYQNQAGSGQAVFNAVASVDLDFNNAPVSEYNISPGAGNVISNPLFLSTTPGSSDFMRLSSASPVIDVADPNAASVPVDDDFEDQPRPINIGFDMGADEYNECLAQIALTGEIFGHPQDAVQFLVDNARGNETINIFGTCALRPPEMQVVDVLTDGVAFLGFWNEDFTVHDPTDISLRTYFDATDSGRAINVGSGISGASFTHLILQNGFAVNGGLIDNRGELILSNVDMRNSQATNGGAIYNASTGDLTMTVPDPLLYTNRIVNVSAVADGGGIYNLGTISSLFDVTIDTASAGNNGGGVYNQGQMPDADALRVIDSRATNNGGGIYNTGLLDLDNSQILRNRAVLGGGLYTDQPVELINTYIFSNSASANGGGVYYTHSGTAYQFHDTIRRNHADGNGGAIHLAAGTLVVSNSLIVESSAGSGASAIHQAGGTVQVDWTDFYTNTAPEVSGFALGGNNYFNPGIDPQFVNSTSMIIDTTSEVIDKGDPETHINFDCCHGGESVPPYDLPIRPQNEGYDLGRWEELREYAVELMNASFHPSNDNAATLFPGQMITYTHYISNAGNISDTYDITIDSSSMGWVLTNTLTPTVVTLQPFSFIPTPVYVKVMVPLTATPDMVDVTVILARSQTVTDTTDTVRDITSVAPIYGFEIEPDNVGYALPGQTITYTHLLTNTGNITDTAQIGANTDHSSVSFVPFGTSSFTQTLGPGQSTIITLTVSVPGYLAGGFTDLSNVTVESIGDPTIRTAAADRTIISYTTGTRHVSITGRDLDDNGKVANNCTDPTGFGPCRTFAHTLDQAQPGDLIKIAGSETFTEVMTYTVSVGEGTEDMLQVVVLDKSVALQGGYDNTWAVSQPLSNPTIFQPPADGRGIFVTSGISATVDGIEISAAAPAGYTDLNGGALYNDGASLTINAMNLYNNTAPQGSAIYNTNGGNLTLQNSFIHANANNAVTIDDGTATIENNTFHRQLGSSGGVDLTQNSGLMTVTNNIFHENQGGTSLHVAGGTAAVDTNLHYNSDGSPVFASGSVAPTNTIIADPLLADPDNGNLHLGNQSSPAVEAGLVISRITDDIDRNVRPIGSRHDLGADEWLFVPDLDFVPDYITSTANFNQVITFVHTITNTGEITDTFDLTWSSSQGWLTSVQPTQVTLSGALTGSQRSAIITVVVTTGPPGSGGLTDVSIITATSNISSTVFDTVVNTTTLAQTFGLTFTLNQSRTVAPKATQTVYTHTLYNGGNGSDTVSFSSIGTPNWPVSVQPPSLTIAANTTETVTVTLTIPPGSGGLTNVSTITARSTISTSIADSVVNTTTVPLTRGVILEPDRVGSGLPGQTITYQHTLTNTGNAIDTFDLTNLSSQGWAVTVVPTTTTVAADADVPVTVTVTIPLTASNAVSGTVDITVITATSTISPAITDAATDTTTVGADPGVVIEPPRTGGGLAGQPITYTHIITNLGNLTDTFTLSASSSQGWSVGLVPSPTIQLTPGQTGTVTATVFVPIGSGGLIDVTTITATSTFSPTIFDTVTDTTTVSQTYGLIFTPDLTQTLSPATASFITYTHILTNTGNGPDTFTFSATTTLPGWSVLPIGPVTVAASAGELVTITISVPPNSGGLTNTAFITATSSNDPSPTPASDAVTDTTIVPVERNVLIQPDNVGAGLPGQTVAYTHTVTNLGNASDSFTITWQSSLGSWTVAAAPSVINNLPGSGNQTVVVSITIPASGPDAISGTVHTAVVTATSHASPTIVSDSAVNTTTVLAEPDVIVDPDRADMVNPNTILTYTHTITNLGNLTDIFTLSVSTSLGWPVSLVPTPTVTLAPNATATLTVTLTVPPASGGLTNVTTVRATSGYSSSVSDIATHTTTVSQTIGLDFVPDRSGQPNPPGAGFITYTHFLTNTGDGPTTYAFSSSNILPGWSTVPINPVINLAAGISRTVIVTVTVGPNSGGLTNTTYITAYAVISPAIRAQVTDTTFVPVSLGVILEPDQAQTDLPGNTVTYQHTLTNSGTITDSFNLSISSGQGWPVAVNPTSVSNLGGGLTGTVTVSVTIPTQTLSGTVDVTTITATSATSPTTISDTAVDTTTVGLQPLVSVTPNYNRLIGPGNNTVYTHTVTNLGNASDTFTITVASSQSWLSGFTPASLTLGPGLTGTVVLTISVPGGAGGQIDVTTITATSGLDNGVLDTAIDTTTATPVQGLLFQPDRTLTAAPGATTIALTHTLTNIGNMPDTYTFSYSSVPNWPVSLPADVTLPGSTSQVVTITLTIPGNSGGLTNITTITATSTSSATISGTVVDTITVPFSRSVIIEPNRVDSGVPGQMLTFNHTVTNTGNAADSFDLTVTSLRGWAVSVNPANTGSLNGGQALAVTVLVTIPISGPDSLAGVQDMVTVTATSVSSPTTAWDTATDLITVNPAANLLIEPDNAQTANPGDTITYNHTVTNTGNLTDTIDFTVVSNLGWAVSGLSPLQLGPGQSALLTITLTVPLGSGGQTDVVTVTATSSIDPGASDIALDTTTVSQTHDLTMTVQSVSPVLSTSTTITFTYIITNNGNGSETISFTITSVPDWLGGYTLTPIVVSSGATQTVMVVLTLPLDAGGQTNVTTLTAGSVSSPTIQVSASYTLTIPIFRNLLFTANETSNVPPGTLVTYTHWLTNTGNTTDTFNLTFAANQPWPIGLNPTMVTLAAGQSTAVQASINIPVNAPNNSTHVLTITTTSANSPTVASAVIVDVTQVQENRLYLPIVVKNYAAPVAPTPTPLPTPTATPGPPQPGPDLVVADIVIDPPVPTAGQPATVYVTVVNQGLANVAFGNNFWIDFYVDPPSPPGVLDHGVLQWSVQGVDFPVGVPQTLSGLYTFSGPNHQLYAQADSDNTVLEMDEGNNVLGRPLSVNVSRSAEPTPVPLVPEASPTPDVAGPRPTPTIRP